MVKLCGNFTLKPKKGFPTARVFSAGRSNNCVSLKIETQGGWNGYLYLDRDTALRLLRELRIALSKIND